MKWQKLTVWESHYFRRELVPGLQLHNRVDEPSLQYIRISTDYSEHYFVFGCLNNLVRCCRITMFLLCTCISFVTIISRRVSLGFETWNVLDGSRGEDLGGNFKGEEGLK